MNKKQKVDYEQIGKMVANIYESGYMDRNQLYKQSLLKGVLGGVGGVIGATLVIALVVWLLSIFKQVPLLGPFTDKVRDTIQTRQTR